MKRLRGGRSARLGAALVIVLALAGPRPAGAQLRPLEPLDWRVYAGDAHLVLSGGVGVLHHQPAPLAGSSGTLLELGTYRILWRSGRLALDLSGVSWWRLHEDTVLRPADPAVEPSLDGVRHDAGPLVVGAAARLNPSSWPAAVAVRFGTRIPTTSDESGLERDRTDFFALLATRWKVGDWSASAEAGVGINGSRKAQYPQSDALLYAAGVERAAGALSAFASLVGQQDGLNGSVRGNEDKGELRFGARYGRQYWLQASLVRGLTGASPNSGLLLAVGTSIDCRGDCLPR